MKPDGRKLHHSEKTRYDKVDGPNAYIKYVMERNDRLKILPYVSLKELIAEATRVAQASGIRLEDFYTNHRVNHKEIIQQ